ncbi:MAG TPA: hypothetical protein DCY26_16805 [Hyphomonas sp.]|nr:hypothetical protein [Hyphomonas sp.]
MDHTLPPPRATGSLPGVFVSLRAGLGFATQVLVGAVLVFFASLIAMMTALAGLMLAAAALLLRYVVQRRPAIVHPTRVEDAPITLNARRTPRGWTVE